MRTTATRRLPRWRDESGANGRVPSTETSLCPHARCTCEQARLVRDRVEDQRSAGAPRAALAGGAGMRIGVLGTGTVGRTLASKLAELGHDVTMGSRDAANEAAAEWAAAAGGAASHGTFADAAAAAELVVNATAGTASLEALAAAGVDNLS